MFDVTRALVLDDNEAVRNSMCMLLRTLCPEVDAVADGAEAVGRYEEALESDCPYSLVILDLTIPGGMGGAETIERLRQIES